MPIRFRQETHHANRDGFFLRWHLALWMSVALLIGACGLADPESTAASPADVTQEPQQADETRTPASTPLPDPTPQRAESEPAATQPTATQPTATVAPAVAPAAEPTTEPRVKTGAEVLVDRGFADLEGLRVGLITHRPSQVDGERLADLIHTAPNVELVALFAPEHGIDGTAAAGASISDTVDVVTNVPVFSLYGQQRSPDGTLDGVDVLVYDLQDVGSRFFTYTSTLGLSMQAAQEAGIPFVVLDRPNPIGANLQGPTLEQGLESFIGLYPIPSAYGLTSGELALLIQREGWLTGLSDLDLRIVQVENWRRDQVWPDTGLDWIAPSPNLPSPDAALAYPGTVLFEATSLSEGRGTDEPFLTIGASWLDPTALAADMNRRDLAGVTFEPATFTPRSIPLAAPQPRYLGEELAGVFITVTDPNAVDGFAVGLHLVDAVVRQGDTEGVSFDQIITSPGLFDRLAGHRQVRADLAAGRPVDEILASLSDDHEDFAAFVADVLLYD